MTKSYGLVRETIINNGDALYHTFFKVDKHVVKKNSRPIHRNLRTGAPYIGKSTELYKAETEMTNAFRLHRIRNEQFETINERIWAVFWFFFPQSDYFTKKGEISGRLPDLSNLYELPQDCLQKACIIRNDSLIKSHDLSRILPGEEYAIEVFLFKHGDTLEKPTLGVVRP